tara:strand:- start:5839 stop:6231 length:393 start_codon:yes stop_codon:yes gene_type:complete
MYFKVYMASTLLAIMSILKTVETNNKVDSIGDDGRSYGILQIQRSVLRDVNRIYGTDYRHRDMFCEEASEEVFMLYLCYGKEVFLKKHCRFPTEQELVRMWNGGIYKGYKYEQTKSYYEKYLDVKRESNR